MKTLLFAIFVIFFAVSCNPEPAKQITGAYAREFTFKQKVLSTGEEVGTATIRDTIFIRAKEQGYEISNHKWRKNDYDQEGWRNLEHAENRPRHTYQARFDKTDNTLIAEGGLYKPLLLDFGNKQLYLSDNKEDAYKKVAE